MKKQFQGRPAVGRRRRRSVRTWLGGVALGALIAFTPAHAFHELGVASCSGCHTIHNSHDDTEIVLPGAGPALLKGANATDVCLTCHATSHGSVLGSDPVNPPPELGAGNFAFLQEDDLNDTPGDPNSIGGHRAGHSIVSPAWHLNADPSLLVAPGGTFPATELGCTSCHDPHGNADYRMLRGIGPLPGGYQFTFPAPSGAGVDLVTEVESPASHTAYFGGWNEWCANCHGFYHEGSPGFEHSIDHPLSSTAHVYNAYDGPSNPLGGSYATAYIPEVPFEDPAGTVHGTEGPAPSNRLTCMTCHRAHATSAPAALRWDPNVLTLGEDGVASFSYPLPNPYTDPSQLSLCVKCHYPEAVDHGASQPCLDCHREGSAPTMGQAERWSRFGVPDPSTSEPWIR